MDAKRFLRFYDGWSRFRSELRSKRWTLKESDRLYTGNLKPFTMRLADGRAPAVPTLISWRYHARRVILIAEDSSWSVIEPLLLASLDNDERSNKSEN